MAEKKPSRRSPTKSSAEPSKAGSRPAAKSPGRAAPPRRPAIGPGIGLEASQILDRADQGQFPATLYVEGPDESLKAALLAELRRAWARTVPEAPQARVFRADESGVDEILAAFHGSSLFSPRELSLVLEVEDLGRSAKKIDALAEGLARPGGASTLVLVESAAEAPRRSLDALRAACAVRWLAMPPSRPGLLAWGKRRLAGAGVTPEPGVLEAIVDACEGDVAATFNELDKLSVWAGDRGRVTLADAQLLLRPVAGADLPGYLAAVALGDARLAGRRLGRLLAAGVSEGTVLFALANLVGGALGGWSRYRDLSQALRRRREPRDLVRTLDALYRAESAWKHGRADVVALLEQASRVTCGEAA